MIAPEDGRRATGPRPECQFPLRSRSILLLHDDAFVSGYISAVLLRAGAQVLESASIGECRELLSAAPGIDAAVLNYDLSSDDTHALAEQLAGQALPHLFIRSRPLCDGAMLMRGRLLPNWPFAGFQVCEALAGILDSDRPRSVKFG